MGNIQPEFRSITLEPKQRLPMVRASRMDIFWQKIRSYAVERYFGIRTTGQASPVSEGGVHYTPLPYQIIFRVLKTLTLGPSDVFVDIGCGKGRVLCCACRTNVGRVVGIEINDVLVRQAVANLESLRGSRGQGQVVSMFAEEYDYSDATVIYLYNPFDEPILRKTLAKIDVSHRNRPRDIRLVYANNVHERPLTELGWLRKYEEWPASDFPGFGYPISFWRANT
jgi:SAM-dependent methyltransferase